MSKPATAFASAVALSIARPAMAALVYVSGRGRRYDPGIALENTRADAVAQCTAQGGTPVEEVYNHLARANLWLASSIWECEVP